MTDSFDAIQAERAALAERLRTLEPSAARTDALNRAALLSTRVGILCIQANHDAASNARRKMDAATTKRDALVIVTCVNDATCGKTLGLVYGDDGQLFYEGRDEITPRDETDPLPERVVTERLRMLRSDYVHDDLMLESAIRVFLHNPIKHPDRRRVTFVRAMLDPLTPPGFRRRIWAPCPDHRDQRVSWELDPDSLVRSAEQARQLGKRVRYEWPFRSVEDFPTARWREEHPNITVAERREALRGLLDYAEAHPNEVEQIRRGESRPR